MRLVQFKSLQLHQDFKVSKNIDDNENAIWIEINFILLKVNFTDSLGETFQ